MRARAAAILDFWFRPDWREQRDDEYELDKDTFARWFGAGAIDTRIREQFEQDVTAFAAGENDDWLQDPFDALAGIIAMDQFTRTIYRGSAQMFSLDEKAKTWAAAVVQMAEYHNFYTPMKLFAVLPFMHCESELDQQTALRYIRAERERLFQKFGQCVSVSTYDAHLQAGQDHLELIQKFGRFPHRNQALGRESSPEEAAGLADGSIKRF